MELIISNSYQFFLPGKLGFVVQGFQEWGQFLVKDLALLGHLGVFVGVRLSDIRHEVFDCFAQHPAMR